MTITNPTGREPGHAHEAEVGFQMTEDVCAILRRYAVAANRGGVYEADFSEEIIAAIRERLAQEVEAECPPSIPTPYLHGQVDAYEHATRIVRGATS